jgi:hypothetical protein
MAMAAPRGELSLAGATSQRRPSLLEADIKEIVAPTKVDAASEPVDTFCAYFLKCFLKAFAQWKMYAASKL